ncbi:MAG TPA: response regulator transcription factor [Bacteroidales bacterium]|nr:response regulator transcription factor [Bacteroidales bacterium]
MTILLADDHPVVREGLKKFVGSLDVNLAIEEATNGVEAWEMIKVRRYDLAILDVSMPGLSGLELLKKIKDNNLSSKVLILSVHPQEQYAIRAIKLGASGYLSKDSAFDELKIAINKILSGGRYVSEAFAENIIFKGSDTLQRHEQLSHREFEIMIMLARGKSVTEISNDIFLSRNTVNTYRTRILTKMHMKKNAEIIAYALKNNLIY